jgi:hypothetical protein
MKVSFDRVLLVLALSFMASASWAGGRYTNPPVGLAEVSEACNKGLEAAQKGDAAAALEQAKIGRKVALNSYKELSTMPMEIGSANMKKALAALDAGNVADSVQYFTNCKQKMDDEIAYYKKEGKM